MKLSNPLNFQICTNECICTICTLIVCTLQRVLALWSCFDHTPYVWHVNLTFGRKFSQLKMKTLLFARIVDFSFDNSRHNSHLLIVTKVCWNLVSMNRWICFSFRQLICMQGVWTLVDCNELHAEGCWLWHLIFESFFWSDENLVFDKKIRLLRWCVFIPKAAEVSLSLADHFVSKNLTKISIGRFCFEIVPSKKITLWNYRGQGSPMLCVWSFPNQFWSWIGRWSNGIFAICIPRSCKSWKKNSRCNTDWLLPFADFSWSLNKRGPQVPNLHFSCIFWNKF